MVADPELYTGTHLSGAEVEKQLSALEKEYGSAAKKQRKMPAQKPHRSKQDYETPDDFIAAVTARYGPIDVDLAATQENAKAAHFLDPELDSLKYDWANNLPIRVIRPDGSWRRANWWLNPEFSDIGVWAAKCAKETEKAGSPVLGYLPPRILFLTPASVGANWFRDHVYLKAHVQALNGRLTFKGQTQPYPKDCILSVFGYPPGFDVWNWREP